MLTKRIIPCLDIKNGKVVKGINFVGLREIGDPVELAKIYEEQCADEIVFLDITASFEEREIIGELIGRAARELSIPLTVGGGIRSIDDFRRILARGADKVSVNSAAIENPDLFVKRLTNLAFNVLLLLLMLKNEQTIGDMMSISKVGVKLQVLT